MKKVLLIAITLLFTTPIVKAQDKDEKVKMVLVKEENSDNYYYEGVVPVEGVTKEEMFKRAKAWVLSNFKTGDNNSQFDETNFEIYNSPTIIVKKGDNYVNFKIKLQFKDGKYKFRFDNLIVQPHWAITPPQEPVPYNGVKLYGRYGKKFNRFFIENINTAFVGMASSLETSIKGISTKKDDNW